MYTKIRQRVIHRAGYDITIEEEAGLITVVKVEVIDGLLLGIELANFIQDMQKAQALVNKKPEGDDLPE